MHSTSQQKPSWWLQGLVFASLAGVYLFLAPNYEWKSEETGTAYGADFMQEWVGARMVLTGHVSELYDVEVFRAWQHNPEVVGFAWKANEYFPPVYPPPHYVLFSPFACVPYRWAVVLWVLTLLGASFLSSKLIVDIVNHASSKHDTATSLLWRSRSQNVWLGMILFPSLLFSITLGQKSACWLLLTCLTWRLLQCHREYAAGFVFGILSIKPTLFFLVPLVLLRNGCWRFFIGASVSVCVIWGGTACLVPIETWTAFSKVLSIVGSYAESTGYRPEWSCNLMTMAYSLPVDQTQWCKWAICLPLSIYLLYCVFEDRCHPIDSPEKAMMLFGATLLISPHTYHYDCCILLLPILWAFAITPKRGMAWYGLLAIGVTVAGNLLDLVHLPILPILLIGILCELRLRGLVIQNPKRSSASWFSAIPQRHAGEMGK